MKHCDRRVLKSLGTLYKVRKPPTSVMCTGCPAPTWSEEHNVLIFQPGNTYARGLTKTLIADFTPEFSATVALKGVSRIKAKKHGRKEGNLTDRHINQWASDGKLPPPGHDLKFDYIHQVLKDRRWLPLAAQFAVGCSELRLATKIDLIVQDLLGVIRILEIKCGFDDYFDIENQGSMRYPWTHVPASFRNKAFLQLFMTEYLFRHSQHPLRDKPYAGAYLLHVYEADDQGTLNHTLDPLPAWCGEDLSSETLAQCLEVLKQSRFQTKNDRKRTMTNGFRRARYHYAASAKRAKTQ